MRPFIEDGDLITVSPLRSSTVKVGDVVLCKTADDRVIVHRVIRKTTVDGRKVFYIKGDAAYFNQPEMVDAKMILGKVAVIEGKGQQRKSNTTLSRLINVFFALLSPFSYLIYPASSKIRDIVRKLYPFHDGNLKSKTKALRKNKLSWSGEDRLLLYCCSTNSGVPSGIGDFDWNVFLEKARNEGISPLVFSRLADLAKHYDISGYVMEELKKDYYLSATKNALAFDELKKFLILINQKEIQVIVMKGAALAETAYGNPALRPMSDIDLLIKKEDLHEVDGLFKKMGYSASDRSVDDVDFNSTYLTTLDYRNDVKNFTSFHIHWHFVNSTIDNEAYTKYIKMDDIRRDAIRAHIADTATWVMSPHHLLIHLSEHALRVTHSLNKLSYFCDIDRAINYYGKGLDWNLLVRDSFTYRLNKMVYLTLYFSTYFIEAKVPEDVLLKLRPKRFGILEKIFIRKTTENKRTPGLSYLIHLSMNNGLVKKLKFVGRTLFPPKDILAQRSYISKSDTNYSHYLDRIREVVTQIFEL